jgi:hypothetical protein
MEELTARELALAYFRRWQEVILQDDVGCCGVGL